MEKITKKVADFAAGLTYGALSDEVIEKSRACLLDYFGYALYGSKARAIEILFNTLADTGECTVIGHSRTASGLSAAFINGAMGHVAELDDTHRRSMSHIGDSIIPAVLAAAEMAKSDGSDLLTAMVVGYDVAARTGESIMPSHYYRGWHPSATVNTLGAAAAAGNILRLSTSQMQHALGIAGTQMCGNFAHVPERGMAKDFNPGRAAFSGLLAAQLAKSGFTASTDFLENRHGLAMFGDNVVFDSFLEGLGEHFKILEVSHKVYTACRHIHSAIDAALEIALTHKPSLADIESVEIESWSHIKFCDDPTPWKDDWYGPRFSAQFNVAVALLHGAAGIDALLEPEICSRLLGDENVRGLIGRTRIVVNPDMDRDFPTIWPARVNVVLKNGRRISVRKDLARGEPEVPVSYNDIAQKFRRLGRLVGVPADILDRTVDALERIRELKVTEITKMLRLDLQKADRSV